MKVTPAHDMNDFDVGQRHKLPMPVVIDEHGAMREVADAEGRVPKEIQGHLLEVHRTPGLPPLC